jgi:hypothetical protein
LKYYYFKYFGFETLKNSRMKNRTSLCLIGFILTISSCFTPKYAKTSAKEENRMNAIISDWIMNFACYPESYKSVSFEKMCGLLHIVDGKNYPEDRKYAIKHTFTLLNKDKVLCTTSCTFVLEYDYSINMVSFKDIVPYGGAFPPDINSWLSKFGRQLTQNDTMEFLKNINKNYFCSQSMSCSSPVTKIKKYCIQNNQSIYEYFFTADGEKHVGFYATPVVDTLKLEGKFNVKYVGGFSNVNKLVFD